MSHSSGIPVSSGLRESFGDARSGNKRIIKVQIVNDELVEISSSNIQGSWEDDFKLIPSLLDKDQPCYILYGLDENWAIFCYVPDKSKVKEKMLYASTRSNLKMQLGASNFGDEVFGTILADFSLEGYKHHVQSKKSEAPLTEQEQIKRTEMESGPVYSGGQTTYVHGVAFPIDKAASDAVTSLMSGKFNYVQIAIDCEKERVILDHTATHDVDGLISEIPMEQPRFHLFAWTHEFEGSTVTSNVYIYSSPDGSSGTKSAPVRMRMLYSSSKANVEEIVKSLGGKIDTKMEINTKEDLSEDVLFNLLHPQKEEKKAAFTKPSRPGKGGRTLIRK